MNNADMPASPTIYMPTKERGGMYKNDDTAVTKHGGLTKREAFAMAAMQGILSSGLGAYDERVGIKCRVAVEYADVLLKELDK